MSTTEQAVTVVQEDREAAASLAENDIRLYGTEGDGLWSVNAPAEIRSGQGDDWENVQAFARHRLASASSASAEPRKDTVAFVQEWMMSGDHEPDQWHRDFAAAIDARRPTEQSIFEAINEECGTDAAAWIIARIAASASPEPVPATNQAGEVEEARIREIATVIYAEVADEPLGDLSQRRLAVQSTWYDAVCAALAIEPVAATQPATSQEGEARARELLAAQWEASGVTGRQGQARARRAASIRRGVLEAEDFRAIAAIKIALAATPTPPTLSEDLRAKVCRIETRDVHDGYDQDGNYIWKDYVLKSDVLAVVDAALALAQVKAS